MEIKKAVSAEVKSTDSKKEISFLRQTIAYAWVMLCLISIPEIAHANPILNGLEWGVDLLTSTLARSGAILALAVCGYLAWAGRMSWGLLINILIGIVLIIGGAAIVDLFTSAVG